MQYSFLIIKPQIALHHVVWCTVTCGATQLWGQRTYDPVHALLGPKAHAEEDICRGRIGKGRNAWEHSRG